MPNFINPNRVNQYAVEIAAAAGLGGDFASRFAVIAAKFAREQADCAKPLRKPGGDAPAWARRLVANGELVHEFRPTSEVTERLRNAAAGLVHILQSGGRTGRGRSSKCVIDRLDRMNFCQLEKAITEWISRKTRDQRDDPDVERCPPARIEVASGRSWTRVTTLRQLDETGEALQNCLARNHPRHKPHWRALCDGSAEYWQLRCRHGRIVCVLEIETDSRVVRDVRARENQVPIGFAAEVRALMQSVGAVSPPIGELTGNETLMVIGLVGPAVVKTEPDVAGKVGRRSYEVWVENEIAVIRLGKQNPEFVVVDANRPARRFAELMTATAYADTTEVVPVLVQAAKSNPTALAPLWRAFVVAADRY